MTTAKPFTFPFTFPSCPVGVGVWALVLALASGVTQSAAGQGDAQGVAGQGDAGQGVAGQGGEAVVVASTAPGFAPGQVIADGQRVSLPDGANALFLFASGRSVRVKGPYEGEIARMPQTTARIVIGGLLGGEGLRQGDLGAARGVDATPLSGRPAVGEESLRIIDPNLSGIQCLAADAWPTLRRPTAPDMSEAVLKVAGKPAVTVAWRGAGTIPWPKELPAGDGGEIQLAGSDGVTRHTLRLRRVMATPGGPALAVRLAAAGCQAQAAALLTPLREAKVPLDVFLSSDRGLYPTYRPGEPMRLVLQANRDAHVHCFLRDPRGRLMPIFPSQASGGSLIQGHVALTLPGEREPRPLNQATGDAPGDSEVRCFAAVHDFDEDLPGPSAAFTALDEEGGKALDRALAGRRDTDMVMVQVILRVE